MLSYRWYIYICAYMHMCDIHVCICTHACHTYRSDIYIYTAYCIEAQIGGIELKATPWLAVFCGEDVFPLFFCQYPLLTFYQHCYVPSTCKQWALLEIYLKMIMVTCQWKSHHSSWKRAAQNLELFV